MGIHIIAEFLGVDPEKISRVEETRRILDSIVARSGLHPISSSFHQFEPYGVSAVYLLQESHLSVHTWPEYGYMALDIFTCGSEEAAEKAFELMVEEFKPKVIEKQVLRRNLYEKNRVSDTQRASEIREVILEPTR
ncbi:adenosylmethionine decarboxylase [Candidatus Bathyarchaeota archaeon]|nr:MAG: adenosylmethionine decarboxylase [Candidatus Bathyarchaeota archaeon]HDN63060.1 adenosylmethionine decarboxylase [Candidatus Bathyarchaeota archaeon]